MHRVHWDSLQIIEITWGLGTLYFNDRSSVGWITKEYWNVHSTPTLIPDYSLPSALMMTYMLNALRNILSHFSRKVITLWVKLWLEEVQRVSSLELLVQVTAIMCLLVLSGSMQNKHHFIKQGGDAPCWFNWQVELSLNDSRQHFVKGVLPSTALQLLSTA